MKTPKRHLATLLAQKTFNSITKGDIDFAMDGDETEDFSKMFLEELNYLNGNMSDKDFTT